MVTDENLTNHYKEIRKLTNSDSITKSVEIKDNKVNKINKKRGFSILIDKTGYTDDECINILLDKTKEIANASDDIKREFVRGCFDGRGSWDTTMRCLSVDVDRDYDKQNLIADIIESLGITVNINRRDIDHKKNDQIRIKKESVKDYIDNVGFYSVCRKKQIENGIADQ